MDTKIRELKYRVWDYNKFRFILEPNDFKYWQSGHGDNPKSEWPSKMQQYTGFKDKYNKEVYEGDILRIQNTLKHALHDPYKLVLVSFNVEQGIWYCGSDYLYEYVDDSDIVGNIYENPELI